MIRRFVGIGWEWQTGAPVVCQTSPRARFLAPLRLAFFLSSNFVEHGEVDEEIATLA